MTSERAFDVCEALSCLAHDWGLYALNTRLDRANFRPSPMLKYETLGEEAREYYDNANKWLHENAMNTSYDPRPIPAGVLKCGVPSGQRPWRERNE